MAIYFVFGLILSFPTLCYFVLSFRVGLICPSLKRAIGNICLLLVVVVETKDLLGIRMTWTDTKTNFYWIGTKNRRTEWDRFMLRFTVKTQNASSYLSNSLTWRSQFLMHSVTSANFYEAPCLCEDLWNMHACMVSCFSLVLLFVILWTVAFQVSLSMGILQARILGWVAMPSSKVFFQPRDQIHISYVSWSGGQLLYHYCHLESPLWNILGTI